jgi:predicted transcriptional regulator
MRDDRERLLDIQEAIERIEKYAAQGRSKCSLCLASDRVGRIPLLLRELVMVKTKAMIDQVDKMRRGEHRMHSKLVREALRTYYSDRFAEAPVSVAELSAIRRGRAQIRRGEYVFLDEAFDDLESKNRRAQKKRP